MQMSSSSGKPNNSIALVFTPQPECRRGSVRYTATVSGARTKDGPLQTVATLDLRGDGANGFPDVQRSSCTPLDVPGGVITRCSRVGTGLGSRVLLTVQW